jgi:hypothetical protein
VSLNSRLNRLEAALREARPYLSVWDLLFHGAPVPDGFDPARDLDPRHLPMWNALMALSAEDEPADNPEAREDVETGPEGEELAPRASRE